MSGQLQRLSSTIGKIAAILLIFAVVIAGLSVLAGSQAGSQVMSAVSWTAQFGEGGGEGPRAGREPRGRDDDDDDRGSSGRPNQVAITLTPTPPAATPAATDATASPAAAPQVPQTPGGPSAAEMTRARRLTPAATRTPNPAATDVPRERRDRDRDEVGSGLFANVDWSRGLPIALRYASILGLFVIALYAIPSAWKRAKKRRAKLAAERGEQ